MNSLKQPCRSAGLEYKTISPIHLDLRLLPWPWDNQTHIARQQVCSSEISCLWCYSFASFEIQGQISQTVSSAAVIWSDLVSLFGSFSFHMSDRVPLKFLNPCHTQTSLTYLLSGLLVVVADTCFSFGYSKFEFAERWRSNRCALLHWTSQSTNSKVLFR